MRFEEQLSGYQARCEAALHKAIDTCFTAGSQVSAAAQYALLGGGKRVRGVLVQATGELLGGSLPAIDASSAAIEMIHAFSLVHDDLPCMDDDDTRRGRPATHIKFGEATALLAGDMLCAEAFEVIAGSGADGEMIAAAVRVLAAATGARGMIYGQELDLLYETKAADEAALTLIHTHKTGALLRAAVQLGMVTAGLTPQREPELARYAANLGLVFQIVDDILDVTADETALGKPIGSDARQGKTTYVTMHGLDNARRQVALLTAEAVESLTARYGAEAYFLIEYANKLANRAH